MSILGAVNQAHTQLTIPHFVELARGLAHATGLTSFCSLDLDPKPEILNLLQPLL